MTNNVQKYNDFKKGDYIEGIEEIHSPLEPKRLKVMRGWLDNINTDFNDVYIRADDCYEGARGTMLKLDTIRKIDTRIEKWWTLEKDKMYFGLTKKITDKKYKLYILSYARFMDYTNYVCVEIENNQLTDYINYFNLNMIDCKEINQLKSIITKAYTLKYNKKELYKYDQEITSVTDRIMSLINM